MDKYRPCPSIIAMFTSDSQHPPRSRHAVYLGEDTFGVFIDFKKAFDYVDRNVLLYKLLSSGINGKFYNSVKSMLSNTSACVRLMVC